MTMQKRTNDAEYLMSKANFLAATGRKMLLINRTCLSICAFLKAFLFVKKSIDRMNLQLYKAKAETWFWFVQSLHMALCPLPRDNTCLYGQ